MNSFTIQLKLSLLDCYFTDSTIQQTFGTPQFLKCYNNKNKQIKQFLIVQ